MPPKRRKYCRSLPPDVLSDLPDNVIDVILMCLPCKDAVRTSILSKKWRYHWCRLTKLTLDSSLWVTKKDLLNPTVKFTKIIYQLLSLHEGPITKFTLNIGFLENSPDIGNFISFLSRKDIQHLVLDLSWKMLYKLPSSLFTCSQLRHLTLRNCLMHPPSAFQGFDMLTSLELCNVKISSVLLESLISRCRVLTRLILNIPEILSIIEINAPMLRSFNFRGDISFICLKNVPLLVKVSLAGDDMRAENLDFAKVFESCSALEHLRLDFFNAMFYDDYDEAPTRRPFVLNSVKRFYLPHIMLIDSYKLSFALFLIRSLPCLEYLEIQVYNEDDSGTEESLELKHLSNVTFNHLREVKIELFTGRTSEMQLIKLLLANSPVLVRMLIDRRFLDDEPLDTRLQVFAEISKFSHASPKAENMALLDGCFN
ncbi:F-box/FBD/LRR-repeat protein At1g13570-like [Nicotiana sylvestris]|uniref:F-box/FBD/LRR-repeat protein At1g13570-like n=1 Tax=Nicotiana sylvestris TaxID=4096 RepID=UPI00388C6D35